MDNVACKICNSETKVIEDQQFNLNYYWCTNCEFIFIDENHIISGKDELKEYVKHENSFENEGYVNMFKRFIETSIGPYKTNIRNVLEFGCGPGPVLAKLLKNEGFEVDMYDPYFAPERVFENKEYDLITSTEVFEHFKDPMDNIRLLKEHLNDNGLLAIMTLFHPKDEEKFKNWWYRRDVTHISFYTPETFRYIADELEMKVLKIDNRNICVLQNS
ncbi:class I SAM-dependent methyltransferase [Wukongibacter baidiensis]|uniref:class I SAM-dependent methyltransferase n=1 Tax=Wukongibacter baidiensis TaxID=1723361 RepID=UPI003D7F2B54